MLQKLLSKFRPERRNKILEFKLTSEQFQTRVGDTKIEEIFSKNDGRVVHKWVDYLPIYERHLSRYRATDYTMLEIGVFKGGSLEMWRKYFGPDATLCGIDIDPKCAELVDPPKIARIGSQDDPGFLAEVVREIGPPDVILDDGSHFAAHQMASIKALWPHLKTGGLYIIEDTHTSYWESHGGGYRRDGTAVDIAKQLIDDQHAWFHDKPETIVPKEELGGLFVYESIFAIEKKTKLPPGHIQIGTEE